MTNQELFQKYFPDTEGEDGFYTITYRLWKNYARHATTSGNCVECGGGGARGGWLCADCVEKCLAGMIDDTFASNYHSLVKQLRAAERSGATIAENAAYDHEK